MTSSWACRTLVERSVEHTTSYPLCCSSSTYIKLLKRSRSLLLSTFTGTRTGTRTGTKNGIYGDYGTKTGFTGAERVQKRIPESRYWIYLPESTPNNTKTINLHEIDMYMTRNCVPGVGKTGFTERDLRDFFFLGPVDEWYLKIPLLFIWLHFAVPEARISDYCERSVEVISYP